jgi:hypothetical protein
VGTVASGSWALEDVMWKSAMTCVLLLMTSGFVRLAWAQERVGTESPVPPNFKTGSPEIF